jgi:hypothetical protein
MKCPDENTVLALIGCSLEPARRVSVMAHVDGCLPCGRLLAMLRALEV